MPKAAVGCLARVLLIPLLAGALYAGWRWDPVVFPHLKDWLGVETDWGGEPEPSRELAAETLERFQRFVQEGERGVLELQGPEVTSILLYSVPEFLPAGTSDPRVRVEGGEVALGARVARDVFPIVPELERWAQVLPDTVNVELAAIVFPFGPGDAALLIRRIEVASIPLPRRLFPPVLQAMGREERPGLPEDGIALPLPEGLSSIYLEGDRIVLVQGS